MTQITMQALIRSLLFLSIVTIASTQTPICLNNLAVYNPNLRTECVNASMLPPSLRLPSYKEVGTY